jgi:endonuclease/exonuclease/phosphatase (EEP) superfamily protein YafD
VQGQLSNWRADLSWLGNQCRRGNVIMAGDFNATLDHLDRLGDDTFATCTDAALAKRSAAVGTWPTLVPPLLGSPIDHVMFSGEWQATGMRVVTSEDDAGSDHRPILAWLGPIENAPRSPVTPMKG